MATCLIEHCPNDRRTRSPVCRSCAASFTYWDKKGPDAVIIRQRNLEKWQDRMQYLGARKSNVRKAARFIEKRRARDASGKRQAA